MITSLCWSAAQCCAKSNCFLICHNASGWPLWSGVGWGPLTHRRTHRLTNMRVCKLHKALACTHVQYTRALRRTVHEPAPTGQMGIQLAALLPFFSSSYMTSKSQTCPASSNNPPCQLASQPASQWVDVKGRCWHKISWNTPTGLQRAGSEGGDC